MPSAERRRVPGDPTDDDVTDVCRRRACAADDNNTRRGSDREPAADARGCVDSCSSVSRRRHLTPSSPPPPTPSSRRILGADARRHQSGMTPPPSPSSTAHRTSSAFACGLSPLPLLLLMTSSVVSGQQWLEAPSNVARLVDQSATFTCRTTLNTQKIIWSRPLVDGSRSNLFVNGDRWDAPGRYRLVNLTDGQSLVLTNLTRDDDSDYSCSVWNVSPSMMTAHLTILVSPGVPRVTVDIPADPRADPSVSIAFTCNTSGGNPSPNVTWYSNGVPLYGATLTPPSVKFGTTSSVLRLRSDAIDRQANFTCSASIDALPEPEVFSDPVYAPRLVVGPFSPVYTTVKNSTLNLTCSVTANPPVNTTTITWFKDGVSVGQGVMLTLGPVTSHDSGFYTCSAANFVQNNATAVKLDVQYAPQFFAANMLETLQVTEGLSVNLTFEVSANPMVNLADLKWYKNGSLIHVGSHYFIPSVRRQDAGVYLCQGSNVLMPSGGSNQNVTGTGKVILDVTYRPGNAAITITPSAVLVGDNVSLTCTLDDRGNPAATFNWTRLNDAVVYQNGEILLRTAVALSDIGRYTCTPYNKIGAGGAASEMLDVIEPPFWISPMLASSVQFDVNETDIKKLNCTSRGRPSPVIRWTKDGELISNSDQMYTIVNSSKVVNTYSTEFTSILYFQGTSRSAALRPEDAGSYACVLLSDLSVIPLPAPQRLNITVRYTPIMNASAVKVAVDASSPLQLVCRSHATPPPSFEWTRNTSSSPLVNSQQYRVSTWNETGTFPYISALNIGSVKLEDLGVYTCSARNDMGVTSTVFNVTVKTVPDAPLSLKNMSQTWESVELSWTPGFDGGYTQYFIILLYISSADGNQLVSNVSTGTFSTYNVTGLYPSMRYIATVFARNRLGDGQSSKGLSVVTNGLKIEVPTSVWYDAKSHTLNFQVPTTSGLCLRVRILSSGSSSWTTYPSCLSTEQGAEKLSEDSVANVKAIEVSFCLEQRRDVCTQVQNATIKYDDVPVRTIIIVVVICGSALIILVIVFIVLCCRRFCCHNKRNQQTSEVILQPMTSPIFLNNHLGNGKLMNAEKSYQVFDNPTMDLSEKEPYYLDDHSGHMTHLQLGPPPYGAHTNITYGSNGSDSGVSTPDTPKPPRRVIHEVVV